MAPFSLLRMPRPKTFLYLMSLRTGTELITLTILVNKITGLYGILALLTGLHLSPLQLSMYIYSIVALAITAVLSPHIRKQSPMQCLALAWFYAIDSIINAAYTAAFGVSWFLVLSTHAMNGGQDQGKDILGSGMMGDAAGFTNPKFNVTSVDIVATETAGPDSVAVGGNSDASLVGHGSSGEAAAAAATGAGGQGLGSMILQSGSIASITVLSLLWAVRVYSVLVVMAYARSVLRAHVVHKSQTAPDYSSAENSTSTMAENPFAKTKEEGKGWKGVMARVMVSVPKSYWLGADESGEWQKDVGQRFSSRKNVNEGTAGERPGVFERERRRRAGTDPPQLRPIELDKMRT